MDLRLRTAFAVITVVALGTPTSAHAALVEWSFTAVVQEFRGNADEMTSRGVTIGTEVSASFILDTSVDGDPAGISVFYARSPVAVEANLGQLGASFGNPNSSFNFVAVRDQDVDSVGVSADMSFNNVPGSPGGFLGVIMRDEDGLLVDSDLFPAFPNFAEADPYGQSGLTFMEFGFFVNGEQIVAEAEITSAHFRAVPVPAALYFMLPALISLLGLRRR